jgi:hypothetical protein
MIPKNYIVIITSTFFIIVFILIILLLFFYITPKTYKLYDFDNIKYNLIITDKIVLESSGEYEIESEKLKNKFIKFNIDNLNLTFTNLLKSENIKYNIVKNNLIKVNNSNLIIKNNNKNSIEIIYEIYE